MINVNITEEMLEELANDIEYDGGLHVGLVFNNWRSRNNLRVKISEVYPLITNLQNEIERVPSGIIRRRFF